MITINIELYDTMVANLIYKCTCIKKSRTIYGDHKKTNSTYRLGPFPSVMSKNKEMSWKTLMGELENWIYVCVRTITYDIWVVKWLSDNLGLNQALILTFDHQNFRRQSELCQFQFILLCISYSSFHSPL